MKSKSTFYLLIVALILLSFAVFNESARANANCKKAASGQKPMTIQKGGKGISKGAAKEEKKGAGTMSNYGGARGSASGVKMSRAKPSSGAVSSGMSDDFFNTIGKEPGEAKEWTSAISN